MKSTYCVTCDSDPCQGPERHGYITQLHMRGETPHGTEAELDGPGIQEAARVAKLPDYRIEALRAASRVMATRQPLTENAVLSLAEQFARWLETGER